MKKRIRASVVVVHNDQILTFLAVDPSSKKEYLFLPGGSIEPSESPVETAIRETFEETGYQIKVDVQSAIDFDYTFHWNGEDFDCLTIFYRGYLTSPFQSPSSVKDADYNKGHRWIAVAEAAQVFSYSPEIRDAVLRLIG